MKCQRMFIAAVCCSVLAASAVAQNQPPAPPGGFPAGPAPGPRSASGPGPRMPHELELSEAQQDRMFAIHHAQAPQLRELDKAEQRASAALQAIAESGKFDEAKARAQANALGQAIAARELLRVRAAAEIVIFLTPEQRAQREQDEQPRPPARGPGAARR